MIFSWYEIKESTKGFMKQPTGLLTCLVRKTVQNQPCVSYIASLAFHIDSVWINRVRKFYQRYYLDIMSENGHLICKTFEISQKEELSFYC